jgi:predicted nucleotidyltransferase
MWRMVAVKPVLVFGCGFAAPDSSVDLRWAFIRAIGGEAG